MNYKVHYDRLVDRAKGRALQEYTERHHIIPKCIGGNNSLNNIVELTAREHFVAHQLLCKMYPGNSKLAYAVYMMTLSTHQTIRNNKEYSWIRNIYSKNHHARGNLHIIKGLNVQSPQKIKCQPLKNYTGKKILICRRLIAEYHTEKIPKEK